VLGRWRQQPEFIIGGKRGMRWYMPRRARIVPLQESPIFEKELTVSGNYQNWSADSPGGLNETVAQVAAGLNQAYAAVATTQVETAQFLVAHGPATINHAPVGEPGRQGDPDLSRDASDG
jgi:hypothetical protein